VLGTQIGKPMTAFALNEQHVRKNPVVLARTVLDEHWDGKLPVDPGVIARNLGVKLVAKGSADQPWEYSGYFLTDPLHGTPTIQYNRADALVRRRFTVAHELGHFVLGHDDAPRDDPDHFGASISDPIERAANQFAAELLMPAEALRELSLSGRMASVSELAEAFLVSKVAMSFRLNNLQLA
jgi:Zn-dependent peptidase ImmA (M78 family)